MGGHSNHSHSEGGRSSTNTLTFRFFSPEGVRFVVLFSSSYSSFLIFDFLPYAGSPIKAGFVSILQMVAIDLFFPLWGRGGVLSPHAASARNDCPPAALSNSSRTNGSFSGRRSHSPLRPWNS